AEAVEHPEHADVREALGAAAREDQRRAGGPALLGGKRRAGSDPYGGDEREPCQIEATEHRREDTTTPCATPRTFVYLRDGAPRPGAHDHSRGPEEPPQ